MEKNSSAIILLAGLIVGFGIGFLFGNNNLTDKNINTHQMPDGSMMNNDHAHSVMEDAMHDMTDALKDKSGTDFDKEFLAQMIVHHEGAVEMARMVLEKSTDAELRKFAQDIIDVQSSEIKMMKNWYAAPTQGGNSDGMVACTMEAKICPDGSAVGRQGPKCEFAKCPGE